MVHGNQLRYFIPLVCIIATACGGGHESPKVPRATAGVTSTAPLDSTPRLHAPWELVRKNSSALLLTDSSMSMAGYDRGTNSELRLLLNALELQLLVSGVDRFQAATFADQVGAFSDTTTTAGMSNSPFDGLTTCLASPWELQGVGLRVILTDSVPSSGNAATQGKSCSCTAADPTNVNCIAKAIVGFAQRGNGIWVIGVKATFVGKYYPELPPRFAFSPSTTVRRPIYIWLGGPNVEQGRRIVADTLQTLAKQGVKDSFGLEVWPGKWSGIQQGPLTTSSFRISDTNGPRCGSESNQPEILSIQDRTLLLKKVKGDRQVLLRLRVPTKPIVDELPTSIAPLVEVTADDSIQVTGARPIWQTEDLKGGCFEISASASEWQTRSKIAVLNPMLDDWSTEDDAKHANIDRTLFLRELWETTARLLASPANEMRFTLLRAEFQ